MIKATVTRTGKSAKDILAKLRKNLEYTGERAVQAVTQHVFDRSQELVPVDTSILKDTAQIHQVGSGFNTVMWVGYGPDFDYHEVYSQREKTSVVRNPSDYAVYANFMYVEYLGIPSRDKGALDAVLHPIWAKAVSYS
jgi:hypothetical protein